MMQLFYYVNDLEHKNVKGFVFVPLRKNKEVFERQSSRGRERQIPSCCWSPPTPPQPRPDLLQQPGESQGSGTPAESQGRSSSGTWAVSHCSLRCLESEPQQLGLELLLQHGKLAPQATALSRCHNTALPTPLAAGHAPSLVTTNLAGRQASQVLRRA